MEKKGIVKTQLHKNIFDNKHLKVTNCTVIIIQVRFMTMSAITGTKEGWNEAKLKQIRIKIVLIGRRLR